jgi:hypothetical protein
MVFGTLSLADVGSTFSEGVVDDVTSDDDEVLCSVLDSSGLYSINRPSSGRPPVYNIEHCLNTIAFCEGLSVTAITL